MKFEFEYIKTKKRKSYLICKKFTNKIEINYMGYICSKKCCKEMDKKFFKALKGG